MKIQEKLNKIKSIINSCETYEQVQSCFSFAKNHAFLGNDIMEKTNILLLIQAKSYSLRNNDLKEHRDMMKQIIDPNI